VFVEIAFGICTKPKPLNEMLILEKA
jgi:hypothetical protein